MSMIVRHGWTGTPPLRLSRRMVTLTCPAGHLIRAVPVAEWAGSREEARTTWTCDAPVGSALALLTVAEQATDWTWYRSDDPNEVQVDDADGFGAVLGIGAGPSVYWLVFGPAPPEPPTELADGSAKTLDAAIDGLKADITRLAEERRRGHRGGGSDHGHLRSA